MTPLRLNPNKKHDLGIYLIAAFKLVKALLLIAVGVGALSMLHKDVASEALDFINSIRIDPDNRYIHSALEKLVAVDDHRLKEIGLGTFIYAAILVTEGVGLALRKRWAEYFTIIITASFIPVEVYEIVKHTTVTKAMVLGVNIAAVVYLILRLRWERSLKQ